MALAGDHLLPSCGRAGLPEWRSQRERPLCRALWGNSRDVGRIPNFWSRDIYVDHRMISVCIRFDSNRGVPYSPRATPHGSATKSLPPALSYSEASL
jgi:hypothetical protein